jgi:large subunit ribosomal protein L29
VSKQAEAVNVLRTMTTEDLDDHLRQQRRRLFEVRFQQAAGQVENHRQVREIRREIARTMTIQLELARGHHIVSDLEVEEETEEQPRPRRLLRRRLTAVPAGEVADPELVDAGGAEPEAAEETSTTGAVAGSEPVVKPRRARRGAATAETAAEAEPALETAAEAEPALAPAGDEPADDGARSGPEIADEGATGPDEEQTDE